MRYLAERLVGGKPVMLARQRSDDIAEVLDPATGMWVTDETADMAAMFSASVEQITEAEARRLASEFGWPNAVPVAASA